VVHISRIKNHGCIVQRQRSQHLVLAHFFEPFYSKAVGGLKELKRSRQVNTEGWSEGGEEGRKGGRVSVLCLHVRLRTGRRLEKVGRRWGDRWSSWREGGEEQESLVDLLVMFLPSLASLPPSFLTVRVQILKEGEEDGVTNVRQHHFAFPGLLHPTGEPEEGEGGREGGNGRG